MVKNRCNLTSHTTARCKRMLCAQEDHPHKALIFSKACDADGEAVGGANASKLWATYTKVDRGKHLNLGSTQTARVHSPTALCTHWTLTGRWRCSCKVTTSNTRISKTVRAVEKSLSYILHDFPAKCTHNICIALRMALQRCCSSRAARTKTTTSTTKISKSVDAIEKYLVRILQNTPKRAA